MPPPCGNKSPNNLSHPVRARKTNIMRHLNFFIVLFYSMIFVVGCQPSKNDQAVKTTTDYAKEAAHRVEERGGCEYSEIDFTAVNAYSFKNPNHWSVPADRQPDGVRLATRRDAIGDFTPNFTIVKSKVDPKLFQIGKRQLEKTYRSFMSNLEILAFEHGKLDGQDVVFTHYRGTLKGHGNPKVEQFQYFYNAPNWNYVLTFSCGQGTVEQAQPEFDAILASYKIWREEEQSSDE